MTEEIENRINFYDYFGFPNRQQRIDARQIFDMEKLRLVAINNDSLWVLDPYFEQYNAWCHHINNYSSHLGLHLLLMYYQYIQKPLDSISIKEFQSPAGAHKIYFDVFAEDASLYLVSYFDKLLEMFNDLYDLQYKTPQKSKLSRSAIIYEMRSIDILKGLAAEYRIVEQSDAFKQIKMIRDDFVHNKSSSYYGMNVEKTNVDKAGFEYASFNSKGISTELTYSSIHGLIISYEHLCKATNDFFCARMEEAKQELQQ